MLKEFTLFNENLEEITKKKALISTINAHSYNLTLIDPFFREALLKSDILIPDGISIVFATLLLKGQRIKKIAGIDLFYYEMRRLQQIHGKCFFLGSSETTLRKIKAKILKDYPNITVNFYSPPYKVEFDESDNLQMIKQINNFSPDVLMVGMTAPKQEKWAYQHFNQLNVGHICCIGAVFDFYAGNIKRAPEWIIKFGMEWFYRLLMEPGRLWKRYLIGNFLFICGIIKEKMRSSNSNIFS